ncbi:MAG TPA: type II secretion system F family protein [Candidatus Paceibacterota bacterium]|nr:type II secretion system F family protein [Candidatus Paceibacterota bacterium]
MLFHYKAVDAQHNTREGDYEAIDASAVLDYVASQGWIPIAIKQVTKKKGLNFNIGKENITLKDKVFLVKYLALMLQVGTDLFKAIDILITDSSEGPVRRFLLEVRSNLEKGKPFYTSFEAHPEYFSLVVTNLIKAGESSGQLSAVLAKVSTDLEAESELNSKVKSSLTYPIILIIGSVAITVFMVIFILPKIGTIFSSTGSKIPTYSKVVLTAATFLNKYFYIFLPIIIAVPTAITIYCSKTLKGKKAFSNFLNKIPVARHVQENLALQRFTSVLASLIKSGMPIIKALEITAQATGYEKYSEALVNISHNIGTKGLSIGDAFKKEGVFSGILSNLIAVGEKAGHTGDILETLSNFYKTEAESSLKTLVAFIEPILILFIGLIVGGLALTMIVPMYQLIGQF